ncbi:uncharacterized protein LOC144581791 [Callithrix jacchus]
MGRARANGGRRGPEAGRGGPRAGGGERPSPQSQAPAAGGDRLAGPARGPRYGCVSQDPTARHRALALKYDCFSLVGKRAGPIRDCLFRFWARDIIYAEVTESLGHPGESYRVTVEGECASLLYSPSLDSGKRGGAELLERQERRSAAAAGASLERKHQKGDFMCLPPFNVKCRTLAQYCLNPKE